MPLTSVSMQGYRSVRNLTFPVEPCGVFVGANGVGKTNLYKGVGLLRAAAEGNITRAVAEEGGIESVMWAGPRRRGKPVRLILKAHFDDASLRSGGLQQTYEIELGLPRITDAAFEIEPMVKEERLTLTLNGRRTVMMERKGALVTLRNEAGRREGHKNAVLASETALSAFRDSSRYPELEAIRRELLDWRLYHDFRTDARSLLRRPCHAITTPTLSPDGHDLAAVLATLAVIRGDTADLDCAIDDAFPGARLHAHDEGSHCTFSMVYPDLPQRSFGAHELSDGTLKYLCLLAALRSYRLPSLIALNEPEASLHPQLLPPLARLIASAAGAARIWVVTHSETLAQSLSAETGRPARRVVKTDGATEIEGLKATGEYRDGE